MLNILILILILTFTDTITCVNIPHYSLIFRARVREGYSSVQNRSIHRGQQVRLRLLVAGAHPLANTLVAHTLPVLMAYNDSVDAFWAVFR